MNYFILMVLLLLPMICHGGGNGLCKANEDSIFICDYKKKIISVCASKSLSENSGYLRYAFGTTEKIDLDYPKNRTTAKNSFKFFHAWSPGTYSSLEFNIGSYTYYTYASEGNNYSEPGNPDSIKYWESNGVAVFRGEHLISNIKCDNINGDIGIAQPAVLERLKLTKMPYSDPEPLFNEDGIF